MERRRWDGHQPVYVGRSPSSGYIFASPAALVAHYPRWRPTEDGQHAMQGVYLHRNGRWEHIEKSESVRKVAIHGTDLVLVRSRVIEEASGGPYSEWWLERYRLGAADARSELRQVRFQALDPR